MAHTKKLVKLTFPRMLYDFHQKQNARKAGSVHATYLITGTRRPQQPAQINGLHSQDEDSFLQSDTFMSSSAPEPETDVEEESIPVRTILLAKEEDLEEARADFDTIHSIHIYSLEPGPIKDLHILTDCNREVYSKYANEDPLKAWKQYGTIQNANVQRRSMRRQPPPPAPVAPVAAPKHTIEATEQRTAERPPSPRVKDLGPKIKDEGREKSPATNAPAKKSLIISSKPETTKRIGPPKKETSELFKSFAKAKPKKQANAFPAAQTPTTEDEPMAEAEEEEQEEDFQIKISTMEEREARAKAKKEREEQLRKMMDDEDVEMADAPAAEDPAQEDEEVKESKPIDKSASRDDAAEKEATVTVAAGRRRGRRRVMKKKTTKDEDGYLVTKEEPVWESFSEDEPEVKKAKPSVLSAPAAKGKKGAKPGQGNIMKFFTKK
ncbi:MAG: hypothetical protein M1821_000566 [Bathelium mastoideum]|nr:MAG: hypothetical protein M1821_000566 [Bathelium mastoideum]